MKILVISKYPPIEGGVSSRTYWLAKGLGESGHEVFVVSNCWEAESEYKEDIKEKEYEFLEPKNVRLFSTTSDFRPPILRSRYYAERIASIAIDVIRKYDIDIIYSHYLLPYGISAMLAKIATKKPLIVQHAGSDITRLFSHPYLRSIFLEVFTNADKIIAYANTRQHLEKYGMNIEKFVYPGYAVNINSFTPNVSKFELSEYTDADYKNKAIFSYFGKISGMKKTYEFVNALEEIKNENFIALFIVGQSKLVDHLKTDIKSKGLGNKCIFLPFLPPWKIPSVMNLSTCVVCPENEETPYLPKGTHGPIIAREAMACGRCAIIGKGVYDKGYYKNTKEGENILVVEPENAHEFARKLKWIIDNPKEVLKVGSNARDFAIKNENFIKYIKSMEDIFSSITK